MNANSTVIKAINNSVTATFKIRVIICNVSGIYKNLIDIFERPNRFSHHNNYFKKSDLSKH